MGLAKTYTKKCGVYPKFAGNKKCLALLGPYALLKGGPKSAWHFLATSGKTPDEAKAKLPQLVDQFCQERRAKYPRLLSCQPAGKPVVELENRFITKLRDLFASLWR